MRVEKSELTNSVTTGMIQALDSDINDANSLINKIDAFITEIASGKNLKGEGYIKVKDKLSQYKTLLEKRKTTAKTLKEAISSATNKMASYIGDDYDVLDEAKLPELNERRSQVSSNITTIASELEIATTEEAKRELNNKLAVAYEIIKVIDKEKTKIEGLSAMDNSAYSILESAKSNISGYNSAVNSVQESQITIL